MLNNRHQVISPLLFDIQNTQFSIDHQSKTMYQESRIILFYKSRNNTRMMQLEHEFKIQIKLTTAEATHKLKVDTLPVVLVSNREYERGLYKDIRSIYLLISTTTLIILYKYLRHKENTPTLADSDKIIKYDLFDCTRVSCILKTINV